MVFNALNKLTGKRYIRLVDRGNTAIMECLKWAASHGRQTVLIQDQGGWLTYNDFPKKLNLNLVKLETDYGLTNLDDLRAKANPQTAVLINSLPGYHALEDMSSIFEICREKGALLINDVSGSIGTPEAKLGNIIIGSFGRWKPLNLEYGGFIATDHRDFYDSVEDSFDSEKLEDLKLKLGELDGRLDFFDNLNKKIKKELEEFEIIHRNSQGINVIVKYNTDDEKEKIIKYCGENKLEYTECPAHGRYNIRVNANAISIEVKRLTFDL